MKKIMALLTVSAGLTLLLIARDSKKIGEGAACSPEKIKQEIAAEEEKCERVKDDPYEDLICERSEMKKRRRNKELKQCELEIESQGNENKE